MEELITDSDHTGWSFMTEVLGWPPGGIIIVGMLLALAGILMLASSYVLNDFAKTYLMAKVVPIPLLFIGAISFIAGAVSSSLWAIHAFSI